MKALAKHNLFVQLCAFHFSQYKNNYSIEIFRAQ